MLINKNLLYKRILLAGLIISWHSLSYADCDDILYQTNNENFSSAADSSSVSLNMSTGISWTAKSNVNWVIITFGSGGQGSGTVNYSITENTSGSSRAGTLTIAGCTFTINQSGICEGTISPSSRTHDFNDSSGSISVNMTFSQKCSWTANTNASWINITGGGFGSGTVTYEMMQNNSDYERTATLTVAGNPFYITQNPYFIEITPVIDSANTYINKGVVSLEANASDSDGYISSYQWSASNGQTATGKTATIEFTQTGTYAIKLTVKDNDGLTVTKSFTVSVSVSNIVVSPVIDSSNTYITPTEGDKPLIVFLKANASDSDGYISSYQWSASNGKTATGKTATIEFTQDGTYTIKLTVKDNDGLTATKSFTVIVTGCIIQNTIPQLINISTRAYIGGGVNNPNAGFIFDSTGSRRVIITARGRSVNIPSGQCLNTTIKLYKFVNGRASVIAENDEWETDSRSTEIPALFQSTLHYSDAALLRDLPAGAYTAIMGCNNNQTGVGMIGVDTID